MLGFECDRVDEPAVSRVTIRGSSHADRLVRVKRSYTTRRVPVSSARKLITGGYAPQAGDLVLARIRKLGQHKRLELPEGRRATLHVGDEIVVCYGNRYAPDQFEAEVPLDLSPCHLVAAGGVAAQSASKHSNIREATQIVPIGVLADEGGRPMNLADHGIAPRRVTAGCPPVLAVLGTSMNAGKTTTVASLILGMRRQGLKVGAAKVTGTGAGGDVWSMTDAGCEVVLDFTDAGVPSTYKLPVARCEAIMETLIARLAEAAVDAIVIEVADGILQAETKALAASATFARLVDQVVFAATDALGAAAGVGWLAGQGLPVIGVSGLLTASPLAMRECAALVDVAALDVETLQNGIGLPQLRVDSKATGVLEGIGTTPQRLTAVV